MNPQAEKFILHSKTFLGLLLPFLTTYLPMLGVPFGVDESALVLTAFDAVVIAIGHVLSLYGMITSTTLKTLKPVNKVIPEVGLMAEIKR